MLRLSLTARLTLFFTVLAALVVLGLGGLFMASADHHFVELDERALQDERQLITNLLSDAATPVEARARLAQALNHQQGLLVQVRDGDGRAMFQSTWWSARATVMGLDLVPASHLSPHEGQGHGGYHAISFELAPAYAPDTRLAVKVAVDTAFHEEFLHALRRSLAWYALAATLVAGLLGWFAAHQGLAPLRAMRKRAADVSAQRLEPRMPVDSVPVEMADLASELNRMLERLQHDFRRLSEFSTDLAHELRTPISNLLTQTQVTLSARRDVDTYRDILASNAEELERMARMVADMLFLAKTEHGVDLPHRERFGIAVEVRALVDFHGVVAEERDIRIVVAGDGEIVGDRLMVRRAVGNLLSNALRHAPAASTVRIDITALAGATEVAVENGGEAIAPALLERVFDRFYSADAARSHPASSGTGLGLAITRAIVQAHGGQVRAQSQPGRTRFVLSFPSAAP